ncbi:ABC transporter ATP-binding protein [Anoxynatronum buryatiense]|uniref:ABC-2 type transport system ATP-binding protein n=1 Tax=Anoxynatronum buryatiense TaxID=489973 RepID=A0AA45WXI4_9CLOT|nr:ABC transporter ATP-binding protein [Anoxynatronum buryatiense]SMP63635.1 ABC-2 type transport system ATP-binding protein [Anoxynatronum buryatiense]
MHIIDVKNLSKRFGDFTAVKEISFSVEKGEVFGFLGPNGAGKTTTINMLTGLAQPTSGEIMIASQDGIKDIKKVQQIIGIVPDESNLYDEMSGYANLVFCASLYGLEKATREKRALELLKQFSLDNTGDRPFKAYSKGMKRKLTIAAGIIHEPEILFLDEPTTGIDVESARQIRHLIKTLNAKGTTIFLTTHYIEDAERLCNRIGFIVNGKVIKVSKTNDLMSEAQQENIVEFFIEKSESELEAALLHQFPQVSIKQSSPDSIKISSVERVQLMPFMRFFEAQGVVVSEARILRPSLEEVFVNITGIEINKLKKEKEGKKK